jgi:hypothetical protein
MTGKGHRQPLAWAASIGAALVVCLASAIAHGAGPVTERYPSNDLTQEVFFDPSVPTGSFRDRIAEAAQTWNKLPGVVHFNVVTSSRAMSLDPCEEVDGRFAGGVIRAPIPGGETSQLAENRNCITVGTNQLIGFRQIYSPEFKFYLGKKKLGPKKKKFDLLSLATHELGHAVGWTGDHFSAKNKSKTCSNNPKEPTMCPTIYEGSSQDRSLSNKDKNPVLSAYGAPATASSAAASRAGDARTAASSTALGRPGAPGCVLRLLAAHRNPELIFGHPGDDCIRGTAGGDDLRGAGGNDTIVGGPGADVIVSGSGHDLVLGGAGPDEIYAAGGGPTVVRCGSGFDRVYTADPGDTLIGCEETPADFRVIPLPADYVRGGGPRGS